ncbi:hypothetical protein AAVH_28430, partial [Aphelenchoides avenae]
MANTVIFMSFAYYFGKLYALLDDYMRQTDAMNISFANSSQYYRYEGVNSERIAQISLYHEQLWTLVIGEVTVLVFPLVHLLVFAYSLTDRDTMRPRISRKIQAVYLFCPAVALVLSAIQACAIYVILSDDIYTIRFLLAKLLGVLLEVNRSGRLPIEEFFECVFFSGVGILKPPCPGIIHDLVVSRGTLNLMLGMHIFPVVIFAYIAVNNLVLVHAIDWTR